MCLEAVTDVLKPNMETKMKSGYEAPRIESMISAICLTRNFYAILEQYMWKQDQCVETNWN